MNHFLCPRNETTTFFLGGTNDWFLAGRCDSLQRGCARLFELRFLGIGHISSDDINETGSFNAKKLRHNLQIAVILLNYPRGSNSLIYTINYVIIFVTYNMSMQQYHDCDLGQRDNENMLPKCRTRPRLKTAKCHQRHPEHRTYSRMINITNRFIVSIWIGTVAKENISRCSAYWGWAYFSIYFSLFLHSRDQGAFIVY